jgi:hypothetical protein
VSSGKKLELNKGRKFAGSKVKEGRAVPVLK